MVSLILPIYEGYTLDENIRRYVQIGSGLPEGFVIPQNERKGVSPTDTYATVLLINDPIEGLPVHSYDGQSFQTTAFIMAQYSVQWYGKTGGEQDVLNRSRQFATWVSSPAAHEFATKAGFIFQRVSDIQQIDDVFLEEYEPRHYVLLEVGYKQTVAEDVPALATPGAIMARTEALTETIYYRYYFPTFGGLTASGTLTKA